MTPRPVESMKVTWVRSRITSSASRCAPSRCRTRPAIAMSNSPVTVTTCWRRPAVWTIETRTATSPTLRPQMGAEALFLGRRLLASRRCAVGGSVELVLHLRLGVGRGLRDQGDRADHVLFAQVHQLDALRGAPVARDSLHRRPLHHPALRDEH